MKGGGMEKGGGLDGVREKVRGGAGGGGGGDKICKKVYS